MLGYAETSEAIRRTASGKDQRIAAPEAGTIPNQQEEN
jgi:hypothetical protein